MSDSEPDREIEKWAKSDKGDLLLENKEIEEMINSKEYKIIIYDKSYKGKFHDNMRDLSGKQ